MCVRCSKKLKPTCAQPEESFETATEDDSKVKWATEEQMQEPLPYREVDAREADVRREHVRNNCPPPHMRLVPRLNWLDAVNPETDDTEWLDPVTITRKQWDDICEDLAKVAAYDVCVDNRWPGFYQQPWFVTNAEINDALHEGRIVPGHARLCKYLLKEYGECLNRTAKKFMGADQWLIKGCNGETPNVPEDTEQITEQTPASSSMTAPNEEAEMADATEE